MKNKSVLITGANIGLGKEVARQLALINETEKIYLGCRNAQKADEAKRELVSLTGRSIFEIVILDVSDPASVSAAVSGMKQPVDALILNAGGQGGKEPLAITSTGMTNIAATNLLGHVVLVDEMIKAGKLNNEVLYVSSEGARGIKGVMKKPNLKSNSVAEFVSVLDGSFSDPKFDGSEAYGYGYIKYIGALWTSANARKYPQIKFISISPGNTSGTAGYDNLPGMTKFLFKYLLAPIVMPLIGMIHSIQKGAARYVEALGNANLKSGMFYGSKDGKVTGAMVEQGTIFPEFRNITFQDNAYEALHSFIK
ncbi:SDR family NAD(P)-dependent oxidoreductase [Chitinophaga sancti]|uniref:SDR family NAD(P)-dependent oxidoreductase n=1 Tax=Chitinophaga sancti TaxID=1004 RepID=UPI003F7AA09C